MLLPALRSAREAAYGAVCQSNQRQIHLAFPMYAIDYDDYIPTPGNGSGGNSSDWHIKLGESGAWGGEQTYLGLNHNNGNDKDITGWPILRCPSEYGAELASDKPYHRWENGRTSYAMNFYMLYWKQVGSWQYTVARKGWSLGPKMPRSRSGRPILFSPSEADIVMDIPGLSNIWTVASYSYHIDSTSDPNWTRSLYAFRHNGSANQLFWDGHVESRRHYTETGEYVFNFIFDSDTVSTGGAYTGDDAPATAWSGW